MKRAVAQLENYLERIEGHTKGTVVLATVFGDVHDIGKSLVNTILTNNGYTVFDLGKQVPIETIIDAAIEHDADAIGLSALLVSTSKQMPLCVQELHQRGLEFPVLIGGAAINRDFGRRTLYPNGKESEDVYEPASSTARTPSRGWPRSTSWSTRRRGRRWSPSSATRRASCATRSRSPTTPRRSPTTRCGRAPHRRPRPRAPRSGAPGSSTWTSRTSSPTSTAMSCSSCTGAAAARGREEWAS